MASYKEICEFDEEFFQLYLETQIKGYSPRLELQALKEEERHRAVRVKKYKQDRLAKAFARFREKNSGSYRFEAGIDRNDHLRANQCLKASDILNSINIDPRAA